MADEQMQYKISEEGLAELKEKLDYYLKVRRLEVSKRIAEARSYGDLSENSEYDAAKQEQAEVDERRSVLLQCVGASEEVYPDFFMGTAVQGATYMLCSDGFRHEITGDEIFEKFQPGVLLSDTVMNQNTIELIELNKQRNERDNISVVLVRTF